MSFPEIRSLCKAEFPLTGEVRPHGPFPAGFAQPERKTVLIALPNHLRPRREKIFGPAPAHPLDGNAKARLWAAAKAYNGVTP